MDIYMEYLIAKKKDTKDKLIIAGIIAAGVVVSLGMFVLMFVVAVAMAQAQANSENPVGTMAFSIGFVLVLFLWYGAILLINTRSIEYEYIVTNNELDIDKVMSKKGRKHLITIDIHEVACMARTDDDNYNDIYKNPPEGVRVLDYSAHSVNGYTYFIDVPVEGERTIVLFEPTSRMVDAIWKSNPRNVHRSQS